MAIRPTTINDLPEDCTMRVIFFSESAPRCARVSTSWYVAAARCYAPIFADYQRDEKILPFTPAIMPIGDNRFFEAVKQTHRMIMDITCASHIEGEAAKFHRSTPLVLHPILPSTSPILRPVLKMAEVVFGPFFEAVKQTYHTSMGGNHALCIQAGRKPPLDVRPVLKIAEDANLLQYFKKLKRQLPLGFALEGDPAQQSAVIRGWMKNHQASLDQIRGLVLCELDLTTLPPEIGNCTNLKKLYLDDSVLGRLRILPPEIGKLINLKRLLLGNNQLVTLPPEIGKCTRLKRLYLYGNQLVTLSPGIGNCTNLTSLDLSRNQLDTLPPGIGNCTKLEWLGLSNNQLDTLPPGIGNCTKLTILDLSGNQIVVLSPDIGKLRNLQTLDLADNPLVALPKEIGQLTNLKRLSLSNNILRHLQQRPLQSGVIADLCALDKIIGVFFEEEKTEEALRMFEELPTDTKNEIYGKLYKIIPPELKNDYWGCAEDAFLQRNGQSTSNEVRIVAIRNFINNR